MSLQSKVSECIVKNVDIGPAVTYWTHV